MVITTNTGEKIIDVFYERIPSFIEDFKVDGRKINIVVAIVLKKNELERKYIFSRKNDLENFIKELGVKPQDVLQHLSKDRVVDKKIELSENNLELWQFLERVSRGIGAGSIFKKGNVKENFERIKEQKKLEQLRINQ